MLKELRIRAYKSAVLPVLALLAYAAIMFWSQWVTYSGKIEWQPATVIMTFIWVPLCIIPIMMAIRGARLKKLIQFIEKSENPEETLAELERMYTYEPEKDVYFSEKYVLSTISKGCPLAFRTEDIVWVYRRMVHSARRGGFLGETGFVLQICFRNKEKITMYYEIAEEQASDRMLEKLHRLAPYAIFGYNDMSYKEMLDEVDKRLLQSSRITKV